MIRTAYDHKTNVCSHMELSKLASLRAARLEKGEIRTAIETLMKLFSVHTQTRRRFIGTVFWDDFAHHPFSFGGIFSFWKKSLSVSYSTTLARKICNNLLFLRDFHVCEPLHPKCKSWFLACILVALAKKWVFKTVHRPNLPLNLKIIKKTHLKSPPAWQLWGNYPRAHAKQSKLGRVFAVFPHKIRPFGAWRLGTERESWHTAVLLVLDFHLFCPVCRENKKERYGVKKHKMVHSLL